MRDTVDELCAGHVRRFGRDPRVVVRAPGRVNLIGEHTDTNGGLVLPFAIDRSAFVALTPREDDRVRVWSRETDEAREFARGPVAPVGDWLDYAVGALEAVDPAGADAAGYDIAIASDVPLGAGMSSSAALLIGIVSAVDRARGLSLAPRERCRLARRAEREFVGVPCGAMDFLASALGEEGHLLRIDCRDEAVTPIPWPSECAALLVADSGERRALRDGRYARRRADCEAALAAARAAGALPPTGSQLCDLTSEDLAGLASELSPRVLRRARHVASDSERVDAVSAALAAGDLTQVGELLCAGMRSLRDDFEVSTPALDRQCAIADALPGVHGSRLFGAGFGGCTLHLVDAEGVDRIASDLADACARETGRRQPIWRVAPSAGASVLMDRGV